MSSCIMLRTPTGGITDPVFGRPLGFYLFSLPVWQSVSGWLLMLAVLVCAMAAVFILISPEKVGAALLVQLCIAGLYGIALLVNLLAGAHSRR